jgi:hypothetical protein
MLGNLSEQLVAFQEGINSLELSNLKKKKVACLVALRKKLQVFYTFAVDGKQKVAHSCCCAIGKACPSVTLNWESLDPRSG